jgi:hypothetical protein
MNIKASSLMSINFRVANWRKCKEKLFCQIALKRPIVGPLQGCHKWGQWDKQVDKEVRLTDRSIYRRPRREVQSGWRSCCVSQSCFRFFLYVYSFFLLPFLENLPAKPDFVQSDFMLPILVVWCKYFNPIISLAMVVFIILFI